MGFFGLGPLELVIVALILCFAVGAPGVVIFLAARATKNAFQGGSGAESYGADTLDVRRWSEARVRWLLAASVWPVVYSVGIFTILDGLRVGESSLLSGPGGFVLFGLHLATMLLILGVMVIDVIIAIKSPVPSDAKVLWVVAVVLGSSIAAPFLFYFLVWKPRLAVAPPLDVNADSMQ